MAGCTSNGSELEIVIDSLITCKVCLGEFTKQDLHQLEACRCLFCVECVNRYLTVMITEGTVRVISCPDAQCPNLGKMESQEIEKLIDKSLYEIYVRLKTEQEVDLDPDRTWCPEVGCETICQVSDADQDSQSLPVPKPVHCPTCNKTFCSICKARWHEDQTCDEYVMSGHADDVGIPFGNEEDAQFKQCPFCQVPLERDKGCAQVMCKRCSHVFCWHCRSSLDHDYLLQHYERGPCRGKLGHPRASIMWYRALVVTIGVLMSPCFLVAVPCLLLIAPCLLCHKYTVCKCCEDL